MLYCKCHAAIVDAAFQKVVPQNDARVFTYRRLRPLLPPKCTWATCTKKAEGCLSGRHLCQFHILQVYGEKKAVLPLESYTDSMVATHVGSAMESICDKCGSRNFGEERFGFGETAHFNICCQNGKTSNIPEVSPPPDVLADLLSGASRQSV